MPALPAAEEGMRIPRYGFSLLLTVASLAQNPTSAQIALGLSVTVAPPPLPAYVQPALPGPGYIWTPGYWAWGDGGYYWVPGTWVLPPTVGLLWTPGYWAWSGGYYVWNAGYWGPHVGFYGGISYGFGYFGHGYDGGYWQNGSFFYNRTVNNISNVNVTNVYNRTVINSNTNITRVSYNGNGGISTTPTSVELAAAHERHVPPTVMQMQHVDIARADPTLRASFNNGVPAVAATRIPGRSPGTGPRIDQSRGLSDVPALRTPTTSTSLETHPNPQGPAMVQDHSRSSGTSGAQDHLPTLTAASQSLPHGPGATAPVPATPPQSGRPTDQQVVHPGVLRQPRPAGAAPHPRPAQPRPTPAQASAPRPQAPPHPQVAAHPGPHQNSSF
jgi:WXXGXW repeat (2 copies)